MSEGLADGERDPRPVVATSGSRDWGLYAFGAILLAGGIWFFSALSASGNEARAPAVEIGAAAGTPIASPAPLQLPQPASIGRGDRDRIADSAPPVLPAPRSGPVPMAPPSAPPPAFTSLPPPPSAPDQYQPPTAPPPVPSPATVFERSLIAEAPRNSEPPPSDATRPTRLANPSWTVSQGTIIPAVLETAFNSTRPGAVRALVQRDVLSFDGTRVLVPRGSRLFGQYEAGLAPGERRAQITWTRLMRPDGVSVALDSQASDPLGRGGVEGDVDSRFWERLGDGLLNTVFGLGIGLAAGEASGGSTILALPGSTQNVTGGSSRSVRPILEIEHGTSVSVYVSRDLDFSLLEG